MKPASKSGPAGGSKNAPAGIRELIAALASSSPVTRKKARKALVALGGPAVPALIQLLSHRQPHVRWEAAKALGAVADPIAASALVNALEDRDGDVRWLAAEGLAALGQDALQPLLAALIERNERDWLCEGAHHICHALVKKKALAPILRPLLAVLEKHECEFAVPAAAYAALSRLRDSSKHTASAAVVVWPTKNGPTDSGRSRGDAERFQDQDHLDRLPSGAQQMADGAAAAS
ncbi:MAG: HEAT repeat domain-containing protein [Thermoguttaceae bacterium]